MGTNTTIALYYTREKYTLTLKAGSNISSVSSGGTYKVGASVSISAVMESDSAYEYKFSAWTDETGAIKTSSRSTTITMLAKNTTLTASATKTLKTYTVTYYDGAGTSHTKQVTHGETFSLSTTRSSITAQWNSVSYSQDYTFIGWSTTQSTASYSKSLVVTSNITLYPVFETKKISSTGKSYNTTTTEYIQGGGIEHLTIITKSGPNGGANVSKSYSIVSAGNYTFTYSKENLGSSIKDGEVTQTNYCVYYPFETVLVN